MPQLVKDKKTILNNVKNTLLIVLGTFVLAFGTGIFIIPFELVTGGVSGIGIILNHVFDSVPYLSALTADVYASIVNWILFFVGLLILGKEFAMKTLVSTVVYPFALSLAVKLASSNYLDGFFNLASYTEYSETVIILATVFGGAAVGAGCALTFLGGGSTGGIDIIALSLCKYFRRLKSSVMIFVLDSIVVILGIFIIDNLVISLLGIVSAFICAIAIDRMFMGESGAFIAQIVSDKYLEINDAIIEKLRRTSTVLTAHGGFTGEEKMMLTVTFSMNQYAEFTAIISSIDKNAFVTVHRAHEINGEGWTFVLPELDRPESIFYKPKDKNTEGKDD